MRWVYKLQKDRPWFFDRPISHAVVGIHVVRVRVDGTNFGAGGGVVGIGHYAKPHFRRIHGRKRQIVMRVVPAHGEYTAVALFFAC